MTNYSDLPLINLVQNQIGQYTFNKEKSDDLAQHLNQIIVDLIKQHGFKDSDPHCIFLLQKCLIDFYKDLIIRFKQHIESIGSTINFQDAFQRTLDDVMSINLQELCSFMKQ